MEQLKDKGLAGAGHTYRSDADAEAPTSHAQEPAWLFPGDLDDLTPIQQETLHLVYLSPGWNALPDANGNALRTLVEKGLVRRIQAARDPITDRRARTFHDSYERYDRELYWRFALTPEGRAVAETAWGLRKGREQPSRRG